MPLTPKITSMGSSQHWLLPCRKVPQVGCCTFFVLLHLPKPPNPPQQWGTLPGSAEQSHHEESSQSPLAGPWSSHPGAGVPGELCPAHGSQDDRFPEALAGCLPHPLWSRPQAGGASGQAHGSRSSWHGPRAAPTPGSAGNCRDCPSHSASCKPPHGREGLQEQQQPHTIPSSPKAVTSPWVNPGEQRGHSSTSSFDTGRRKELE